MIKLCKDCRYFIASLVSDDTAQEYAKCVNSGMVNPVTGEPKRIFCETNRREHNACGIDAKLYKVSNAPNAL